ncbi:hypothetical protein EDB80DRAFT_194856 [Ilyonectria destructans]|nr:hypothetical protein EDB80DRAFT_194856 [Ilyonectria destructans]
MRPGWTETPSLPIFRSSQARNLRPLSPMMGYRPSFQDPGMTSVAVAAPGRLPLPLQLSHAPKACETTSSSALERQEPSLTSWGNPGRAGAGGQGHRSRRNRHHASISPSYDSEEADNGGRERGARSRNHSNRPPPFNASHHVPSHCIPLHPITSRRCNLRVCDAVGRVQSWPFAHLHHISYSGPVGHDLHLRICLNKPNQTACLLSWILRTPSTTCGWRPSNS